MGPALTGTGAQREAGLARLHKLLLQIARGELARRSGQLPLTGPELDDLAYQAAADALVAITRKLGQFRGESRFTTWAYKFVIFEVSAKVGPHSGVTRRWRWTPRTGTGCLPVRARTRQGGERRDLADAVRRAVDEQLTPRQRQVFVAIVVNGVPLDALAAELGSTRGAIYKMMFDARGKLRAARPLTGYLDDESSRRS